MTHCYFITVLVWALFSGCLSLPYFEVFITSIDNPAGTLANGEPCSHFGFVGAGCNNVLYAGVSSNFDKQPVNTSSTQVNTKFEKKLENLNVLLKDVNTNGNTEFTGFILRVSLLLAEDPSQVIDSYTVQINTTETSGVSTYTSQRPGTLPTTISFAWTTDIPPPSISSTTTSVPETTTVFTGSTTTYVPTTTAKLPVDCSEIVGLTASGAQTIYPDGVNAVQVYCDVKSYGVLTVIQSRDRSDTSDFNKTYTEYIQQFGTPSAASNYWFGLENMYQLTIQKQYTLLIDLCCGTGLVARQIYHNFQIGSNTTYYTLGASADLPGIGLDYSSTLKDIGAPFNTKATYNLPAAKDSCDEFEYEYDMVLSGGWWYGSCGNNLNGAILDSTSTNPTNCSITNFNGGLGVNLRTTTGTNSDGYDVDLVSYNRVRMAVFTFDSLLIDKTDASFCQ